MRRVFPTATSARRVDRPRNTLPRPLAFPAGRVPQDCWKDTGDGDESEFRRTTPWALPSLGPSVAIFRSDRGPKSQRDRLRRLLLPIPAPELSYPSSRTTRRARGVRRGRERASPPSDARSYQNRRRECRNASASAESDRPQPTSVQRFAVRSHGFALRFRYFGLASRSGIAATTFRNFSSAAT